MGCIPYYCPATNPISLAYHSLLANKMMEMLYLVMDGTDGVWRTLTPSADVYPLTERVVWKTVIVWETERCRFDSCFVRIQIA